MTKCYDDYYYELVYRYDNKNYHCKFENYFDCYSLYLAKQYQCDSMYILRHIFIDHKRISKVIHKWDNRIGEWNVKNL